MKKKEILIKLKSLIPSYSSSTDLFLQGDFLAIHSYLPLSSDYLKILSSYNIKEIESENQPEFWSTDELNLRIGIYNHNQITEDPLLEEFWQNYHLYYEFISQTLSEFKKTGKVRNESFNQPYGTFSWKLKEYHLIPRIFSDIRKVSFNDPVHFHVHIIIALTILVTVQGAALSLTSIEMTNLAKACFLCTLGLLLVPINQKKIFSPIGFNFQETDKSIKTAYEKYPILSAKIASKNEFTSNVILYILQHRETIDQRGFPSRPTGFKIEQGSQILGISYDFCQFYFSSLEEKSFYQTFLSFYKEKSVSFETSLLKNLFDFIIPYKLNEIVKLKNGKRARVLQINEESPQEPLVSINLKNPTAEQIFEAKKGSQYEILKGSSVYDF